MSRDDVDNVTKETFSRQLLRRETQKQRGRRKKKRGSRRSIAKEIQKGRQEEGEVKVLVFVE